MRAWLAVLVLASGCAYEAQGPVPVAARLDPTFYAASVQPVVAWSCATLDCHGVDGRPLRVYAEHGLRRSDALRGQPISAEELAWNVAAFEGVDPDPSREHVALTKPLAVEAGGLHHVGDPVWASRDDPGCRCLASWIAGELDPAPCAEAAPDPP